MLTDRVYKMVKILNSCPGVVVGIAFICKPTNFSSHSSRTVLDFRKNAKEKGLSSLIDLALLLAHPMLSWVVAWLWNSFTNPKFLFFTTSDFLYQMGCKETDTRRT